MSGLPAAGRNGGQTLGLQCAIWLSFTLYGNGHSWRGERGGAPLQVINAASTRAPG